ncbi:CapA family protein [Bordetella sp. BOR01]|uniref:CapA family protein n=1 Tax=Bordetella sp. BOR01 TaxID=2854779 RepID=UPI001C446D71|nr:CapA family protein [Bordetella sp. BOR01]MBV7485048.1 CapA family protein [Bordetella sp. BOR01]
MSKSAADACPRTLTLAAVGDLYLGSPLRGEAHPAFLDAVQTLRSADVRLANLECLLLGDDLAGAAQAPGAWAGAPASLGSELQWLGLDVVSTANNHAGDYGDAGLSSTWEALRQLGIAQAGTGTDLAAARQPAYVDTPAGRLAVIAASSSYLPQARAGRPGVGVPGRPGVAPLRFGTAHRIDAEAFAALQRIAAQLPAQAQGRHRERALARDYDREHGAAEADALSFFGTEFIRSDGYATESWPAPDDLQDLEDSVRQAGEHADFVVACLHTHEFDHDPQHPAAFAQVACRRAIEAGADAVIGHGEHGVRAVEIWQGKPIFYGIGAFVFQPYRYPRQPADFLEAYAMRDATLAQAYQARRERAGFFQRLDYWEAMLLRLSLHRHGSPSFEIHPITLWQPGHDTPTGVPHLARNADGIGLLEKIAACSRQHGTRLRLDEKACVLHGP